MQDPNSQLNISIHDCLFACLMAAINNAIRRSTNTVVIASCMSVAGPLMLAADKNEHFSVLIVHRPR
ncbi:hypothetical protein BT96DRAFT_912309 [Gymnopus androsaceus JB14]|uniref:Uncharacterized protein n=1 Tax=Gymnopus androsaceus JB14 TaxID=1447944 RepID=A0A6A4IKA2_9AGAR|nr:hypothetical protein BT96DRAFT_912309 [Gymnopus androsaceus JB14]